MNSHLITENTVLESLRNVIDPDLHQNIVDLGFIKNLKIQNNNISLSIELTTPACPVKDQMKNTAIESLKQIPGVQNIDIQMTAQVKTQAHSHSIENLKQVKNIIAVASGKGGVGKSTVAVNLALALANSSAKTGLLDADIYGPSIPTMLGVMDPPKITPEQKIIPIQKHGLKLMSMGFLSNDDQPVIWRGPMVHGIINQFLNQVDWGELDYLVIDLPPGTGDAQLTLTQNCPITGAVIVSTPQDVSLIDARKGLKMFQKVNVPILGIIENMSLFSCPHCQKDTPIFGHGNVEKICQELAVPFLGYIPIDPEVVLGGDQGLPIIIRNELASASIAFRQIIGEIARKISIQSEQVLVPELTLEWKP